MAAKEIPVFPLWLRRCMPGVIFRRVRPGEESHSHAVLDAAREVKIFGLA